MHARWRSKGARSLARSPSHTEAALHWEGGKRCGGGLPRGCVGGFEAGGAEVNGGWAREPPIERRAINRGGTEGQGQGATNDWTMDTMDLGSVTLNNARNSSTRAMSGRNSE